jgi:hypothetical protein
MGRFFHVIAFGVVTLLAPGFLFSQVGGGGNAGGSFSSSMTSSGSRGTVSSSGTGNQTTFTYNYPPGETVFATANAPYSGHMSSQTVRTLQNGVHLNMQMNDQPMIYRDSLGRTRTDATMSQGPMIARAAANFKPRIQRLPEISDPIAGFRYVIDDANRVAHRISIRMSQNQAGTRAGLVSRPTAQAIPHIMENGVATSSESLGTQSMFGITVTGQRTTTTYPPGTYQGNAGPLTSVSETWRSNQYGLTLLSKNIQPDGSESTTAIKDFGAAEPAQTLFMVPAGYQIVDETGQFTITQVSDAKQ